MFFEEDLSLCPEYILSQNSKPDVEQDPMIEEGNDPEPGTTVMTKQWADGPLIFRPLSPSLIMQLDDSHLYPESFLVAHSNRFTESELDKMEDQKWIHDRLFVYGSLMVVENLVDVLSSQTFPWILPNCPTT